MMTNFLIFVIKVWNLSNIVMGLILKIMSPKDDVL
jgi:hypothetical protein